MEAVFRRSFVAVALALAAATGLSAGGWSVITLSEFPAYAMAGRPLTLTFTVRQHGNTMVSGLKPSLQASTPGAAAIIVRATPTSRPGEYTATLELDRLGDWSILVDGGFNPDDRTRRYNSISLPQLRVIPAGTAPLVLFSEAERGASLLVTKGCVSCHAAGSDRDVTKTRLTVEQVKALLTDPRARPTDMPDLNLKPAEISALAATVDGANRTIGAPERLARAQPSACEVTRPNHVGILGQADSGNVGNGRLSVSQWPDGTVVFRPGGPGFVTRDGSLGMKFGWQRGVRGRLTIEGRRLDAAAPPLLARVPDGYGDFGFQSTYLIFSTPGCWEVTGHVGGASLTFVTRVARIGDGPAWRYDPPGISIGRN